MILAKLIEAGKFSKTVIEGKWTILVAPSFAVLAITNASPEGLNFITSTTVVRLSRIFSGLGFEEDLGEANIAKIYLNSFDKPPEGGQRVDVDNTTGASCSKVVGGESDPSGAQTAIVCEFVQRCERPQVPHVNLG